MPLFIDRLPFHVWIDSTRTPPLTYWTVVLPVLVAEPMLSAPPPVAQVQEWVLDSGNRGEAFAWRHHIIQAGIDPDQGRLPQPMAIHTIAGRVIVPVRDVDLWLVSNLTVSPRRRIKWCCTAGCRSRMCRPCLIRTFNVR